MTREEAINILNSLKNYYNDRNEDGYVGFNNEDNEALDMAIKALSAKPCDSRITYKGKPLGYSEHGFLTEFCGLNKPDDDIAHFESDEYVDKRIENYDKLLKSGIIDCAKDDINIDESGDNV